MAYINGKEVLFSATVDAETVDAKLQAKEIEIIENGESVVTADSGYDGLSKVSINVNVPNSAEPILQEKTVTENGTVTPDSGYDGLSKVTVNVSAESEEVLLEEKEITVNGTYTASEGYDGISKVVVNVPSEIPDGYIQPSGTKVITDTYTNDVSNYQYAVVSDANLIAENIKKGVTILGIVGTYEGESGGGGDTSSYTLSGSWVHTSGEWANTIEQNINGVATTDGSYDGNAWSINFTKITLNCEGEPYIEMSDGSNTKYMPAHTVYSLEIDFGNTAQEVSEEFYNWFTSAFSDASTVATLEAGTYNWTSTIVSGVTAGTYTASNISISGGDSSTSTSGDGITLDKFDESQPYVSWSIMQGASTALSYTYADFESGTYSIYFYDDAVVSKSFYDVFIQMFTKQ